MRALRNIRLEWHFLGVFEYAQAQNVGHFSWKQSVTNFGLSVDAWRPRGFWRHLFFKFRTFNPLYGLLCCMHLNREYRIKFGLSFIFRILRGNRSEGCDHTESIWHWQRLTFGALILASCSCVYRPVWSRSYANFYRWDLYRLTVRKAEFWKRSITVKNDLQL